MKKNVVSKVMAVCLVAGSLLLLSWGRWGHQHINNAAVFALPESMRPFFYNHIDFITEEAIIPDTRKYSINDKAEFPRHYINMETYQPNGPADSIPYTMKDAVAKFDAKTLDKGGILPWYMMDMMQKLTQAFKDKRKAEILFLSADLGHYLGDANMPLHTALNHDGQLTDQKGIHAFFESQLPEQFGDSYNFYIGNATYVKDVPAEVWRIVMASHKLADTLLLIEKNLKAGFDPNNIFEKDSAGNIKRNFYHDPIHTYAYAKAYHDALHGMVEKQLRAAAIATANFWYTAWVNAGSPDLSQLDDASLTERNKKNYKKDYQRWKKGELFGFKVDKEF
ncbi:MAG: zinc dependent phospholipase C family protein [Chitinophagaceae bacterium]